MTQFNMDHPRSSGIVILPTQVLCKPCAEHARACSKPGALRKHRQEEKKVIRGPNSCHGKAAFLFIGCAVDLLFSLLSLLGSKLTGPSLPITSAIRRTDVLKPWQATSLEPWQAMGERHCGLGADTARQRGLGPHVASCALISAGQRGPHHSMALATWQALCWGLPQARRLRYSRV